MSTTDKNIRPGSLRIATNSATANRQLPNVPRQSSKTARQRHSTAVTAEDEKVRERQGSIPPMLSHNEVLRGSLPSDTSIWSAPKKPTKAPPPPPAKPQDLPASHSVPQLSVEVHSNHHSSKSPRSLPPTTDPSPKESPHKHGHSDSSHKHHKDTSQLGNSTDSSQKHSKHDSSQKLSKNDSSQKLPKNDSSQKLPKNDPSSASKIDSSPALPKTDSSHKLPRSNLSNPVLAVTQEVGASPRNLPGGSPRVLPPPPPKPTRPLPDPAKFRPTIDFGGGMIPQEPKIHVEQEISAKVASKYTVLDALGSGGYAKVYLVIDKKKNKFALKVIDKQITAQAGDGNQIQVEIEIMKKLNHPNVISFAEHIDSDSKAFLILELMGGGELLYQIQEAESTGKFYSEDNARSITTQLLKAMSYIHSNSVLHRDLKPENLMFKEKSTDATLKIIDFGLATILKKGELSHEWCGTPDFQAPEMVKRQGYSFPLDMWAVGVIVYILLAGTPPFKDLNTMRLYAKIVRGAVDFPDETWSSVSPEAKEFTKALLTTDPDKRLTADQAVNHAWIKSQKKRRELPTPPPRPKEFSTNLQKLNTQRRFKKCGEALLQSQRYQIFQPAAAVRPPDPTALVNGQNL